MSDLADAVPKYLFVPQFDYVDERVLATDWATLQKVKPDHVAGICMFIWDEMVERKATNQPFKIAPYVENGYKGVARFVENELGKLIVSEAYAVSYFNEITHKSSFVDVSLVRCFPDDIHIADVEFSDNRRPLHAGRKLKGSTDRGYHGLHIFGEFIERLRGVAREKGVERISLMVADAPLYQVFKKHGFEVSKTKMAQMAFNIAGTGFPMILKVK